MSLQKQLRDLRRKKEAESRNFHVTYVHTKRSITRAVSPDRLIRRHVPASLGFAAIAGLLLAPQPGRRSAATAGETSAAGKPKSLIPGWVRSAVHTFVPQLESILPATEKLEPAAPTQAAVPLQPAAKPSNSHFVRTIALELGALLLSKIDLQELLAQLIDNVTHRGEAGEQGKGEDVSEGMSDDV